MNYPANVENMVSS